eukprot:7666225-Pyramimonas_sp.AAC.1
MRARLFLGGTPEEPPVEDQNGVVHHGSQWQRSKHREAAGEEPRALELPVLGQQLVLEAWVSASHATCRSHAEWKRARNVQLGRSGRVCRSGALCSSDPPSQLGGLQGVYRGSD